MAFSCKDYGNDASSDLSPTLRAMSHSGSHANAGGQVAVVLPIQNATRGKSQNGLGIGGSNEPMYTLDQASQHAVCVTGDITHTLKAEGFDGSEDGTGRGQPIVACREIAQTITSNYGKQVDNTDSALGPNVVAVSLRGREGGATAELGDDVAGCLRASTGGGDKAHALINHAVRRLTPAECEKLQGFPDDYTLIPWRGKPAGDCPDGPRYKAIGNSKAVPVVRWIGRRIQQQIG